MASLQAALKNAIQVEYQLEDSELAAEPLPSGDERHSILFYESAEGVLSFTRLVDDPDAFARVAAQALQSAILIRRPARIYDMRPMQKRIVKLPVMTV
jgi:hypothetical protein